MRNDPLVRNLLAIQQQEGPPVEANRCPRHRMTQIRKSSSEDCSHSARLRAGRKRVSGASSEDHTLANAPLKHAITALFPDDRGRD